MLLLPEKKKEMPPSPQEWDDFIAAALDIDALLKTSSVCSHYEKEKPKISHTYMQSIICVPFLCMKKYYMVIKSKGSQGHVQTFPGISWLPEKCAGGSPWEAPTPQEFYPLSSVVWSSLLGMLIT